MTFLRQSLLVGIIATSLAAPPALAEDCVESVSRVPMMTRVAAGPGGAPLPSRLSAPVPPPRLAMARLSKPKPARAARAQVRKAQRPKAALHRKARLAKPLAKPAAPVRLAATTPPKGYPDARLMMTRLGPPAAQPEFALVRTIVCTTGVVPDGRLMPLLVPLPGAVGPTESYLDGEGPDVIGPPFTDDGLFPLEPPFGPPPAPPTLTPPIAPVPEPSTWALMILGFGFVGAGIRRKRARLAAQVHG